MGDDPVKPIFVVGASRSGTGMMMRMLRGHPDINIAGETHYFDDLRTKLPAATRDQLDDGARCRVEDYFLALAHRGYGRNGDPEQSSLDRSELRHAAGVAGDGADAYFRAYCELQARRAGKTRWGEKTPRHVFRIDEMLRCFPSAQVICMMRDPRAVVASYREWTRPGRSTDVEDEPWLAEERDRKARSYDPVIASLLWRSVAGAANRARRRHGEGRIFVQRYEDLIADPALHLDQVSSWLGTSFDRGMLDVPHANSSYGRQAQRGVSGTSLERWRGRLDDRDVILVQSVCGREMRALGYPLDRRRFSSVATLRAWLTLPLSLTRALMANRRRTGNLPAYVWRRVRAALR